MPASQTRRNWRVRWLPVLFWTGAGLAPLATLFLLLGQGAGPLRLAAVLAILCVVLIGLSIVLRNDAGAVRAQLESIVLDEIDALREESREDIVAVARKLHSTFHEEAADLADQLEEIRDQLSQRIGVARAQMPQPDAAAFNNGLVRTETVRQWQRPTVASDEVDPRSHSGVRPVVASAAVARPVSGLPQRSVPDWAGTGGWQESRQPAATGRATIQPPSQRNGHHDDYPGTRAPSRSDPFGDVGSREERAQRTGGIPASPVSPSPVSPGPVSAVPSANWHYPNGGGYPNGGNPSNGSMYQRGGRNSGRRRAPEPDGPAPMAAIESGHHTGDPWADLRGDGEPSGSLGAAGSDAVEHGPGYYDTGARYGRTAVGSAAYQRPEPSDTDWRGSYR
jgi:hypothetical protein